MEDKELQELFAAKRTTEANRRRQEELRHRLEATVAPETAPKTRRLWPVWTSAAAAALLLLLLTMPVLFRQPEEAPLLTAYNETLSPTPQEEKIAPKEMPAEVPQRKATKKIATIEAIEKIEKIETIEPEYYAEEQTPIVEPETRDTHPADTLSTFHSPLSTSAPTIHRRTSTNMVCSNCSITNVPTESTALQNFLVATFGAETLPPLTLKNIEF